MVQKWPLHPHPYENQLLCYWIKDLAETYEISYLRFCADVLELTPHEISKLNVFLPEKAVTILSNATGVPIDDLKERSEGGIFHKLVKEYEDKITEQEVIDNQAVKEILSAKGPLLIFDKTGKRASKGKPRVVDDEKREVICKLLKSGKSRSFISREFNIKRTTLHNTLIRWGIFR